MNKKVRKLLLTAVICCLGLSGGALGITGLWGDGAGNQTHQTREFGTNVDSADNAMQKTQVTDGKMQVIFLDVGQGDCTIVRANGADMVIDCGDKGSGDMVVEYLREQGIETLDYLILTHPDADHIGGADEVLESIEVECVLMPDVANDTKAYEEVQEQIKTQGVLTEHPSVGDEYRLGDAVFWILCPEEELVKESDLNGSSLGIKLVHGENSFVMCGDAESVSEQAMVARFGENLECDVLKCGHHGSSTATSPAFLQATNPTWAVISCGAGNSYGHPHAEVLAALEEDDVQVYRTDRQGTIIALSDGKELKWSAEKAGNEY